MVRDFRILADDVSLTVRSDKRRFPPFGLHGGGSGSPSISIINPGPEQRILPVLTMEPTTLRRGDLFRHVIAGGGGYGPARERDPGLVRDDVVLGKVTIAQARDVYRVVLTEMAGGIAIDEAATRILRADAS
jgi:N-methylhydantoinase B